MKLDKLKNMIGKALGIKSWDLNNEGRLELTEQQKSKAEELFGAEFLPKLEQELKKESNIKSKNMSKKQKTLVLLSALLAVESLEMTEDGVFLNQEQLDAIEAELQKQSDLQTERDTAVENLESAETALDELDETVAEADSIGGKVEAIREKMAKKPGAAATGTQSEADDTDIVIEGADEITEFANEYL